MRQIRLKALGVNEAPSSLLKFVQLMKQIQVADIQLSTQLDYDLEQLKQESHTEIFRFYADLPAKIFEAWKQIPNELRVIRRIDTIVRTSSGDWPKCYLRKALHELILFKAPKLDTASVAIVVGESAQLSICIDILAELGFKRISVVGSSRQSVAENVAFFRERLLGIDFNPLIQADLVLQAGHHTLCINNLVLDPQEPIFNDILYYNYLKPQGLVINLEYGPVDDQGKDLLLDEAHSIKSPTVSRAEVDFLAEAFWLDELLQARGLVVSAVLKESLHLA